MSKRKMHKLFNKTIKKWEDIVYDGGIDKGWVNCAFCLECDDALCCGCPIREYTANINCVGSPYKKWREYVYISNQKICVFDIKSQKLAKDMLEFLKELKSVYFVDKGWMKKDCRSCRYKIDRTMNGYKFKFFCSKKNVFKVRACKKECSDWDIKSFI